MEEGSTRVWMHISVPELENTVKGKLEFVSFSKR